MIGSAMSSEVGQLFVALAMLLIAVVGAWVVVSAVARWYMRRRGLRP